MRLVLAVLGAALACVACAGGDASDGRADAAGGAVEGEVVVMAAASLTDAFEDLADGFEAAHPATRVVLTFAGSQTLATQILQGAPADVLATADPGPMRAVAAEGLLADDPQVLTTTVLAIAVEAGNPLGVRSLSDLADPDLVLVLAAPDVPAGRLAAQALDAAGVSATPASLEVDVRAALAKVELGEADAAIVYASDLVTAGDTVEGVAIPDEHNVVAEYPIATLADAPNPAAAASFVDHALADVGQAVLAEHGFTGP